MFQSLRLISRALRYRLRHDRAELRTLLKAIPSGGCAIDVGAHKGAYTVWMARAVGRGGRVLALEPQPALAKQTAETLEGLGLSQVTLTHAGVSDRSGSATLRTSRFSTHAATLEDRPSEQPGLEEVTVPIVTLDDAAERAAVRQVHAIKIDAEGHELAILRGARGLLQRHRPLLLVEIEARHHASGGNALAQAMELLAPLGYRCRCFDVQGLREPTAGEVQGFAQGSLDRAGNNFVFDAPPAHHPAARGQVGG